MQTDRDRLAATASGASGIASAVAADAAAAPAGLTAAAPARPFRLRAAEPGDIPAIVELIRGLAEFERLTHLLQVTPENLEPHLFGPRPVAEVLVAESQAAELQSEAPAVEREPHAPGHLAGFALYFTSFSTFLARPGLYLEDLYVRPAQRGHGIGRALLHALGRIAAERGYGRFEWSVLDWNEGAIRFYERMGATLLPEWRLCRISGEALQAFRG